jgi:hypothetical protein
MITNIPALMAKILIYADYHRYGILFNIMSPGCRKLCYKLNLDIYEHNSSKDYYRILCLFYHRFHREDDLPAVVSHTGYQAWYYNGKRHRDNNLPAIIYGDGTAEYYIDGIYIKN